MTYRVIYIVELENGSELAYSKAGVTDVCFHREFISFSYELTDTNRLAGEGVLVDGKLINLVIIPDEN